jgi:hypothetical protein
MGQPKTMRDVRSLNRLPSPMGLRSEQSRALQLHRLALERKRLDREFELGRQKQRTVELRLRAVDAQMADLGARLISGPVPGGIDSPLPPRRGGRSELTVEY